MTWLIDNVPYFPSTWDGGEVAGLGVKGIDIPSTGESGPSIFYEFYTPGVDDAVEFRAVFQTVPSGPGIEFYCDELGVFTFIAPDGVYQATFDLYLDGVIDPGSPYPLDMRIGQPTLTLIVQDNDQSNQSDNVSLSRSRLVVIQDNDQPNESDNIVALSRGLSISVNPNDQVNESDNVAIYAGRGLVIQDNDQPNQSVNVVVAAEKTLVIADNDQANESDNITVDLSSGVTLTIASNDQSNESGNITITRRRNLSIADNDQDNESDNIVFGISKFLAIQDNDQANQSDSPRLSLPGSELYLSGNNVIVLAKETQVMVVTAWTI